jgi:flagellar basal-body rod modification protein FlgD
MIRFDLPTAADVRLLLYDAGGRLVRRIAGGTRPPGSHSVNWDGRDDTGRTVPDGVYLMRLEAGRFADTQKVIKIHGASPY